ncbi:hypothetical protein EIQ17_10680 [Xanthomonas campestris pv. campestris]
MSVQMTPSIAGSSPATPSTGQPSINSRAGSSTRLRLCTGGAWPNRPLPYKKKAPHRWSAFGIHYSVGSLGISAVSRSRQGIDRVKLSIYRGTTPVSRVRSVVHVHNSGCARAMQECINPVMRLPDRPAGPRRHRASAWNLALCALAASPR